MDARFLAIVRGMNLTHLETAALRLSIARNDTSIRAALELFRQELDEDELVDTLRRIARKTIEDTMKESNESGGDANDSNADAAEDASTENLNDSRNGNSNNNDEDEDGVSAEERLMSSQAARDHVFPVLISELTKEGIIRDDEGKQILKLFAEGNTIISAALDIYDLDNDMAELVDTLQSVARNADRLN